MREKSQTRRAEEMLPPPSPPPAVDPFTSASSVTALFTCYRPSNHRSRRVAASEAWLGPWRHVIRRVSRGLARSHRAAGAWRIKPCLSLGSVPESRPWRVKAGRATAALPRGKNRPPQCRAMESCQWRWRPSGPTCARPLRAGFDQRDPFGPVVPRAARRPHPPPSA